VNRVTSGKQIEARGILNTARTLGVGASTVQRIRLEMVGRTWGGNERSRSRLPRKGAV
jgi:hypothetical protein